MQPANRLPPETLSHIARYVLDENAKDTKSIIPLTHVCRYWRESIVSTPGNWTLISSERNGLAVLSLERCKTVPLRLWLDFYQIRENPGFSALITPHIQNAKTLRIGSIETIEAFAQTLPNFSRSMPNLQSLSLSSVRPGGYPDWDWGLSTPALTRLSLKDINLQPSFLHLRTLTDLSLCYHQSNFHLDALLDFLEGNQSLERVVLEVLYTEPALQSSRPRAAIRNRLQSLTLSFGEFADANALISSVTLQRGAHLGISLYDRTAGLNVLRSIVSVAHLSNLNSPTHMEYNPDHENIRLLGPAGSFSFGTLHMGDPFAELPQPHLTNIRSFRLIRRAPRSSRSPIKRVVLPSSPLPTLETFTVECEVAVSHLLSTLFSNPSSSPSLRILAFLDCNLDEDFMGELTRFASTRKNTTSARLHRVVIVNSKGELPSVALIDELWRHVPVVDVRVGRELPADLT